MTYTAFNTAAAEQASRAMATEFIILRQLQPGSARYEQVAKEFLLASDALIRLHRNWNGYGGVMNYEDTFYEERGINLPDGWMAPVGNTTEAEDLIEKFYLALNRNMVRYPSMDWAAGWLRLEASIKDLLKAFGTTIIF